jgi:hypothetical protein
MYWKISSAGGLLFSDHIEGMSKREAGDDLSHVPTLGVVAEEARFAPLRELLEPVKGRPVTELGAELRAGLLEDAGELSKPTVRLMQAFFGACDARAKL